MKQVVHDQIHEIAGRLNWLSIAFGEEGLDPFDFNCPTVGAMHSIFGAFLVADVLSKESELSDALYVFIEDNWDHAMTELLKRKRENDAKNGPLEGEAVDHVVDKIC